MSYKELIETQISGADLKPDNGLERLRHLIINMLIGTRGAGILDRLEVELMDGTRHEIVDVAYIENRAAIVFIAQPLGIAIEPPK